LLVISAGKVLPLLIPSINMFNPKVTTQMPLSNLNLKLRKHLLFLRKIAKNVSSAARNMIVLNKI